jgi:TRAP-type mannitol/chloroaromatic compound transport system substrate-binding protein
MNRRTFFTAAAVTTTAVVLDGCNDGNRKAIDYSKHPKKSDEVLSSVNINRGKKTELKIATSWPAHFPIMGTGVDRFAERVGQISGGQLSIKLFPKNTLVPALAVFDAASSGQIDGFHSGPYYWKGKNSAFSLFSGFPFGMTAEEINGWLAFGGGMELWRELYGRYNLYPFAGGNTNIQMGGWFRKPITSLEDMNGLKMRIPGLGGEVMSKLGVNPVLLPAGEIYTSLERGVIDATEWVGPYLDLKMGFYKVAPYYYSGWHEPGSILEMTFSKHTWDKLSAEQQAIIECAVNELNSMMTIEFQAKNAEAMQELEANGVILQQFPAAVTEAAKKALAEVIAEQSAQSTDFKRVYESASVYLAESKKFSDVSLRYFLNVR